MFKVCSKVNKSIINKNEKSENIVQLEYFQIPISKYNKLLTKDLTLHRADKHEQLNLEPQFQFASQHPHKFNNNNNHNFAVFVSLTNPWKISIIIADKLRVGCT